MTDTVAEMRAKHPEFYRLVESMTNWQRHQWSRAGYPGLRTKGWRGVYPFTSMAARAQVGQPMPGDLHP